MVILSLQLNDLIEIIVKVDCLLLKAFQPLPFTRSDAMYLYIVSSIIPEAECSSASVEHLINDAHCRGFLSELPIPIGIYFNANQGKQFRLPLVP